MKFVFFFLSLFLVLPGWSKSQLSRQWSRSTLQSPHYKFRHQNRMAPLLTDALVIQGNAIDGIKAFRRKSGHMLWALEMDNGVEGGAVLDENRLYFGANNGKFYCVDVNSGAVLWTYDLNSESLSKPLVQGQIVYHVTGNNTLYAFNKNTGESLWVKTNAAKSNMTVRGQTAPIYESGVLYLGFSDGSFAAINAQNGRQLWSKRIGDDKKFNDVDATPVITDACILISSFANALYCIDKNTGNIKWRHDEGGYFSVMVADGLIYYPTLKGEIHLLDAQSGKLIRKVINIDGLATTPVAVGPYIVYGETEGKLIVRNKNDLQEVASFSSGLGMFAPPSVDPKTEQIYFVSNDANIYRVDLKDRKDNRFLWSEANVTK